MTIPDDYFAPRALFARALRTLRSMLLIWAALMLVWMIAAILLRIL